MNRTKCTVATTLVLAVSACSTSMPHYGDTPTSAISIRPLPQDQQEAKNKESALPIKHVGIVPGSIKPIALPALHITPAWTLTAGKTIGQELQAWGVKAGWKVIWNLPKDWTIPATTSFSGDFPAAAGDVITTLAANGALIRAQFFEGNKTLVVIGPGITTQ